MARYIEYETDTGRIISELISPEIPASQDNISYLELPEDQLMDFTGYAVRDGALVKDYETNEERLERERVKREMGEKIRLRVRSMVYEFVMAVMDDNTDTINALKDEFKRLKVYL